jgi:SAM-dependent methyltransferase
LPETAGIPLLNAPHIIFDRSLLELRKRRARKLGRERFLMLRAEEELSERLVAVSRAFARTLLVGTSETALAGNKTLGTVDRANVDLGTETVTAPGSRYDLAVSLLELQWFNDLPGVLTQIKRLLKPDGLLLAAMIGGDTLTELRESFAAAETEREGGISPRVSPFVEVRTLGGLLQRAGFALPVTDVDRFTVRYANALELMRDLRRMGATNVLRERSRKPLKRTTLMRAVEIYQERFAGQDGRVSASFEILWLSGWAPHESQQQPLKPGSAKARLADALRAVEISAGDKAGPKKN